MNAVISLRDFRSIALVEKLRKNFIVRDFTTLDEVPPPSGASAFRLAWARGPSLCPIAKDPDCLHAPRVQILGKIIHNSYV